jgi:hypothetical protein
MLYLNNPIYFTEFLIYDMNIHHQNYMIWIFSIKIIYSTSKLYDVNIQHQNYIWYEYSTSKLYDEYSTSKL